MKNFLVTLGITLGFFLLGAAVHAEMNGTNKPAAAIGADAATVGCPDCSGTAHTIQDVTFYAGTECECVGTESLTIGPNVIVQSGAKVTFKTPTVKLLSLIRIAPDSMVEIVRIGEPPASLSVTADPAIIPANGTSYSIISATLTDGFGQPAPKGTKMTFETTSGAFSNGAQTHTVATADDSGMMADFLTGTIAGTAEVIVTSGTAISDPSYVLIYDTGPDSMTLKAKPNSLPADGVSTSTITATVMDVAGSAVADGTIVTFTVTAGTGTLSAGTATTTGGTATVTYTASTTGGTETITAECTNGTLATVDITLIGIPGPGSLSLSTSRTTVKSDNAEAATITATVLDNNNASFQAATVQFSSDGGQISASSAVTDANGHATVQFSSGTTDRSNRTVTITGTVAGLPPEIIPVQIVGSTLSLSTNKSVVPDDGSSTATLNITAQDAGGTSVYNTVINITVSGTGGATVTPVTGKTDVNGEFQVSVAGTAAGTVIVTAAGLGATATQNYTVSSVGTEFSIVLPTTDPSGASLRAPSSLATTPNNNTIAFLDSNPDTITRADGGSFIADGFLAGDKVMVGGSTSNDGVYTVNSVTAAALTLVSGDSLTPEAVGSSVTITNGVLVRVRALSQNAVTFATSIGVWDGSTSAVTTRSVAASGYVWSVLTSNNAGSATVQVYDENNSSTSDKTTVVFSAASEDAATITLQASTYVVPLSSSTTKNTVTLTATVRSSAGQVVGNAPVVFSIKNTTGGGETVSPVIALTDSSGIATSTFTSGSLSTGAEGVAINATVLDEGQTDPNTSIAFLDTEPALITRADGASFVTDGFEAGEQVRVQGSLVNDGYYFISSVAAATLTLAADQRLNSETAGASVTITAVTSSVNIVIGETAGSVAIGRGSTIYEVDDATYRLPMSVLVADSNGNPVPGAVVTLSAWPDQYSSGVWYDRNNDPVNPYYQPYFTRSAPNEDLNENMVLDPGEDTNGDGDLTPRNSAAGDVPTTVTTGANGVAAFDLVYLKSSAVWIYDRIRASTYVLGTEITTSYYSRLPYSASEGNAGYLPDSPYPIGLVTDTTSSVSSTFPQFGTEDFERSDSFMPTDPLFAGSSSMGSNDNKRIYTYDPTGGDKPAQVGDVVWDWITATGWVNDWNGIYDTSITVYFPVRIAVKYGSAPESVVEVNATPSEITADGVSTSTITASVTTAQGQPAADGTIVNFTTTSGTLSAATAATVSGVASVTLTSATTAGKAKVTAKTADGSTDNTEVSFIAGPVASVTVSATPSTMQADGSSTSTIKATATDINNNPVSGETISFTAMSGTLSAATATTVNGVATVTYTTPSTVPAGGTDTVTATSSNGVFGTTTITITAVPVGSVAVTSGSSTIVADGSDSTVIRATVRNTNNQFVPDGTTVNFSTTAGTLSAASATTTNGVATVTLTSATNLGTATVTATSGGVNDTTTVTFVAGPVNAVAVSVNPNNLSADGISTSTIRATVTDANNNVVSGETINFTSVSGILSAASALTNANGVATVTYTAPNTMPAGGADTVTATSTNGTTGSETITIISANVGSVSVTPGSSSIVADGTSATLITAIVKDTNGNNIADGTSVSFITTAGTLSAATATTTNGVATLTLTSPTILGTATITATSGGVNDTTTVSFVAGPVTAVNVLATPDNLSADGVSTSTIQATVKDLHSNPVSGETISFVVVSGSLSAATAITNPSGIATVTYTAPNTVPPGGIDTVMATSTNGTMGSDTITIISANVGSVSVTSGSSSIVADGTSSTFITAMVKDTNGNNIADGTSVSFTTTAGTLSAATATTTNGVATVTIMSSTNLGTATIMATSGGVNDTTTVSFVPGPVSTVNVLATPDNLSADGVNTSTIQATVRDLHSNPVSGETISFAVVSGSLSAATAVTNASGIATVTYTAPNTVPAGDTDTVTAISTNGTSGSDTITIIEAIVGSVKVAAGSSTIVADGTSSTVISATVKDTNGNNIIDGTTVSFTTTAGVLSSATAITANGVATVTLTSSTSLGTAMVMATSGGVNDTTNVDFIAGPVATLRVSGSPSTLLADGSSTSSIRAVVRDAQGNRVADGEVISFVITIGTGALSASSAPTVGGFATVTYTASNSPGPVAIQAMASNGVSFTTTIYLTNGAVGSITLTASPASIPANGSSSSGVTAVIKDTSGNPVVRGTFISFSTNLGTFSNGSTTFSSGTIDDSGEVTVSLIAGVEPGTATVIATSGGVSQSAEVEFTGNPVVGSVEVTADPVSIPADGASTSAITATMKTADNQVIPDVEVTFTTARGAITSPHITDQNGEATAQLRSDRYNDSSVTVTASSQGIEGTVTVAFTGVELSLEADPSNLLAGESSTITATLKDAAGNPIRDAILTFSTDKGSLDHATRTTDAAGQATVQITSSDSGTATVTVTGRGAEAETEVNFTRYLFTLEANPTTIRVGETSQITCTLLDNGVPKATQTVDFSSTLGILSPFSDMTGVDGTATTILTAGTQAGIATIDANVTIDTDTLQLSANTQVVITGGDADKIILAADPSVIATNTGVSTITATVYDANDQPSPDQDIYFRIISTPGGGEYLSASVKTTNTYGIATVEFYAGSLASTYKGVEIEANTEPDFSGSFGLITLTIAGPVANIGIGMNLETLELEGGSLKIDISGIATDVNGNPVADGTKINFAVEAVEFDEDRANDHTIDCWDNNKIPLTPCPPIGAPGLGVTWFSDDVNQDGTMYSLGGPMSTTEDVNHNGILDPGEDKNDNGAIDPIQGTVIEESVDTTGGVAATILTYPAPQANNIMVRITAEAGGVSNFYETILLCTQKMVDQGTCGIGY